VRCWRFFPPKKSEEATRMTPLFSESLLADIRRSGIVATLTIDDPAHAVPLAKALAAGGVNCLELAQRTPSSLESLRRICAELPDLILGAGTVLSPAQAAACQEAGAAFGVAPGTNPRVMAEARRLGLSFAPGVCTPSDMEHALEADATLMKFFPGGPCGGLSYLKTAAAPFMHLGVQFIPMGGLDGTNAEIYLKESFIPAVGGSWMAPRELVARQDWEEITVRAKQAAAMVRRARGGAS
jgi:2-dehydro-3-deoxyphosphogluconate aldolase/(4S)-4-hydroxy-2-oxoglutarate aldolase